MGSGCCKFGEKGEGKCVRVGREDEGLDAGAGGAVCVCVTMPNKREREREREGESRRRERQTDRQRGREGVAWTRRRGGRRRHWCQWRRRRGSHIRSRQAQGLVRHLRKMAYESDCLLWLCARLSPPPRLRAPGHMCYEKGLYCVMKRVSTV